MSHKYEPKVLLYSGGFDSFLLRKRLRESLEPLTLLHFNVGVDYSKREQEQVRNQIYAPNEDLKINDTFRMESEANHYVPLRNIYFFLKAFEHAPKVFVGTTVFDFFRDTNEDILKAVENFMKVYYYNVPKPENWKGFSPEVISPHKDLSKSEALNLCLEENVVTEKEISELISCYAPTTDKGCGKCSACVRKAVALANNDIGIDCFDQDVKPHIEALYKDQLEYMSTFSLFDQWQEEYEKALDK
ncbi:7-cyano-7-deazaguanine synthase [Flammeovirga agarivorans]|uniref:7-cyano-7-deazaguanine synthase n=1 Tax=Flammeovirga agarivorans TaxID=2726742 RepID=A0A7X8SR76_9BACT|nr:7-cyano-7-deazaguanine synthase [Flammeovirga agarivorans]NLR94916.1 hypothetical protein [Flammeovirga agarivorans]